MGNKAVAASLQRLMIGKIPPLAWRQNEVGPWLAYSHLGVGDDVADFEPATRTAVRDSNAQHYASPANAAVAVAVAAAAPAPVSDRSHTQLRRLNEVKDVFPEVDHIVPYDDWGCNDPRNARVLSHRENRDANTPRPPTFELVALENDDLLHIAQGAELTVGQANALLDRLDLDNVGQISEVDDDAISDIYYDD